jgi:hypothetical protein
MGTRRKPRGPGQGIKRGAAPVGGHPAPLRALAAADKERAPGSFADAGDAAESSARGEGGDPPADQKGAHLTQPETDRPSQPRHPDLGRSDDG